MKDCCAARSTSCRRRRALRLLELIAAMVAGRGAEIFVLAAATCASTPAGAHTQLRVHLRSPGGNGIPDRASAAAADKRSCTSTMNWRGRKTSWRGQNGPKTGGGGGPAGQ
jgi:hypothetical protein